jgi:hypothetical protein
LIGLTVDWLKIGRFSFTAGRLISASSQSTTCVSPKKPEEATPEGPHAPEQKEKPVSA